MPKGAFNIHLDPPSTASSSKPVADAIARLKKSMPARTTAEVIRRAIIETDKRHQRELTRHRGIRNVTKE